MSMGCGVGTPAVSLLGSMAGSLTSLRLFLVDLWRGGGGEELPLVSGS